MTEEFIVWDDGGFHIPDEMRPNVQLGTRMPNGLCVSLSPVVVEDLGPSDFGLTFLKGHWLPTTKDSDTEDLDSISVTAASEDGTKVLDWVSPVVAGLPSVGAGVGKRWCCRSEGLVFPLFSWTHEIEIDSSSVGAPPGDSSVVAALAVGSTSCKSLVVRSSNVVISDVVKGSRRASGVESITSLRAVPSLCFWTTAGKMEFEPSSPLCKSVDEKMWVGRWM